MHEAAEPFFLHFIRPRPDAAGGTTRGPPDPAGVSSESHGETTRLMDRRSVEIKKVLLAKFSALHGASSVLQGSASLFPDSFDYTAEGVVGEPEGCDTKLLINRCLLYLVN